MWETERLFTLPPPEQVSLSPMPITVRYFLSEEFSDKYENGIVVNQSVARDTEVPVGTVIDYAISLGPKEDPVETEAPPTPEPTEDVSYVYIGSVTISGNPFDFPEDSGKITLVLMQDGTKKTVWEDVLCYDDFPKKFEIEGWSENNGTVTLYRDDEATGNSYNVEFKRTRE